MWLSDRPSSGAVQVWRPSTASRRGFLAGSGLFFLGACGFTPVYGPEGSGTALVGAIALPEPTTEAAFLFNQRFEERMGRAGADAPYRLELRLQKDEQDIGTTATGTTTRYRLIGRAFYTMRDTTSGAARHEGRTNAFTGYSATGSTVATRAAESDAEQRLMTLLADQVIDDLLLAGIQAT